MCNDYEFTKTITNSVKKVLKSVSVIFLTAIALNLLKYNNVANAGGGRMPCSIIEYNYECFSVEAPNYLSTAFIKKQQKDSRYLYLSNFLKSYEYNNNWCNSKLSKSLEFLYAIQKHFPNNETAYRLGASRIIFTGNYCFKKRR